MSKGIKFVFAIFLIIGSTLSGQTIRNNKVEIDFTANSFSTSLKSASNIFQSTEYGLKVESEQDTIAIQTGILKVPFEKPEPFLSAGAIIEHSDKGGQIIVQIKYSNDSNSWSAWNTIEKMDNAGDEPEITRSDLYFMEKDVKFVQFQLILQKTNGEFPSIKNIEVSFISPGATPKETQKKNLKSSQKITQNAEKESFIGSFGKKELTELAFDRPEFIDRKGWACPDDENTTARELTEVTHLIIHHSAGSTTSDDFAAVVRAYWDYHVNSNGWDDIGYNWLVDGNGVIYKGRAWYDDTLENVKGAHNSGKNSGTAGLCMIGNYVDVQPTEALWNSTYDMLAFLSDKYKLNPTGSSYHAAIGRDNYVITGHKDSGGGTACPGSISEYYSVIREEVSERLFGPITKLDDFEINEGHFGQLPTFSGTTQGISATSTLQRINTEAYEGQGSLEAVLIDDSANNLDWIVRILSGSGNPANNDKVLGIGTITFWLKTSTATSGATVSIWIDDTDGLEASQAIKIKSDDQWHQYSFDLGDLGGETMTTGNGQIDADTVTLDGIVLAQADNSSTWTVYFDDVKHNPGGSGTQLLGVDQTSNSKELPFSEEIDPLIFPNPSNGHFQIRLNNQSQKFTVEIMNTAGLIVSKKIVLNESEQIDVSDLPRGIYFVRISNKEFVKTGRLLLDK